MTGPPFRAAPPFAGPPPPPSEPPVPDGASVRERWLPRPQRRRPWATVVVLAWAAVVGGLGYGAYRHDEPTAREQTTIDVAFPTLDASLGGVVTAALDDAGAPTPGGVARFGVTPLLSGYQRVDSDCRVTLVRHGVRYQRSVDLYLAPDVGPGDVRATLERLASALPPGYGATVTAPETGRSGPDPGRSTGASAAVLTADAGNFVAIRGVVRGVGIVRITADTGCRPVAGRLGVLVPFPPQVDRAPVRDVLGAMGVTATSWRAYPAACAAGGSLWTVEASAPVVAADTAQAALPPGARHFPAGSANPEVWTFQQADIAMAVRAESSQLVVSATTGCRR